MLLLQLIEEWLVKLSVEVILVFLVERRVRSLWTSFFSEDCLSYLLLESSFLQLIVVVFDVVVLSSTWVSLMRCKRIQDDFFSFEVIRVQCHSVFFHWIPGVHFVQSSILRCQSACRRNYQWGKWLWRRLKKVHPRRGCICCMYIILLRDAVIISIKSPPRSLTPCRCP